MTPEPTIDPTLEVSSTGLSPRLGSALAYSGWWVTGLVVWFLERRDTYVRFHAAQAVTAFGLVSFFVAAFLALAAASLSFLPSAFAPFMWAAGLTMAVGIVLWGIAIWTAASGRTWRIPLAADLADRLV